MIRILSLGAGVQSSTLLLMAARGEFEHVPDAAIFADTGWEPQGVYDWLAYLEDQVRGVIPVYRVGESRNIRDESLASVHEGGRYAGPPLYTIGKKGDPAPLRRQCTKEYKLEPILAKVRELVGLGPGQRGPRKPIVEQWLGISLDEVIRMKPSRKRWIEHRWPLIERGMDRQACLRWFEKAGLPVPPKSACIACPYTDPARWRDMKLNRPDEFAEAVAFDRAMREGGRTPRGAKNPVYVHRSLRPLDEIDFSNAEDRGQVNLFDDFGEECEGMCGV